jgi:hypothetical protein
VRQSWWRWVICAVMIGVLQSAALRSDLHRMHALPAALPGQMGVTPHRALPRPTITPYVRPALAQRMEALRPLILRAAAQHHRPELSGMSETDFAIALTTILYNEHFGWFEDRFAGVRPLTPWYQEAQRYANQQRLGSNFSVWPSNLRPSVAHEILQQTVPLANQRVMQVPITVAGSQINPDQFTDQAALYAAITAEMSRDDLAIAYLAANLERGIYRAAYEGVPISWRTLAAWHNQGIVDPVQYRANPTSRDYVRRASAYVAAAHALIMPRYQQADVGLPSKRMQ